MSSYQILALVLLFATSVSSALSQKVLQNEWLNVMHISAASWT